MQYVEIAGVKVSRLLLGGNPFSGFSHQSPEMDQRMVHYYSTARIIRTMHDAAALGINTFLGRGDEHICNTLTEYWNEGGALQWFCQTCPELGSTERCIDIAASTGAKACYIHGGVMDHLFAQDQLDPVAGQLEKIRDAGMLCGLAAHNPKVIEWADGHVDCDFYMCCYYNPTARDENPEHVHGAKEWFRPEDRDAMTSLIQRLSKPAIHYKIFAAGRTDPAEAFDYVAKVLRPSDTVCIGIYTEDKPDMLAEDVRLFEDRVG